MESTGENDCDCGTSPVLPDGYCRSRSIYAGRANKKKTFPSPTSKRNLQANCTRWVLELYSLKILVKCRAQCATKQLYIRDFEVSYKNASGGKKKKRKVLDISDLMIPQGSVVGVVGNNGAGKTTLLTIYADCSKPQKAVWSMNGKTYMANQRIKTCYMVMQDVNHQLLRKV